MFFSFCMRNGTIVSEGFLEFDFPPLKRIRNRVVA